MAVNEYTEIGWEGPTDELALFMLIGGCYYTSDHDSLPIIDPLITKIGISFISDKKYKSIL